MRKENLMTKSTLGIVAAAAVLVLTLSLRPAHTQTTPTLTLTRDAATLPINGELLQAPNLAMVVGAQGSSIGAFRARTLIACDQFVSKDLRGVGGFGLASANGKTIYVCGYSISNGGAQQDVQFGYGVEVSSGSGTFCSPGDPVTGTFHLSPYQFVAQGSGVGMLFKTVQSLCVKIKNP